MSANSGDGLNLRHCPRDPASLHDHRGVHTVDELRHLHNRDIDHLVNTLHNDGHVDNLVQELDHPARRQLRNLHSFQHRQPVLVEDLLNKTLESPSWEKTSKTTGGRERPRQQPCPRAARSPRTTPTQPRTRQQPCPRTARRRQPHPATPSGNPIWGSRALPQTDVKKTVVSLHTGLWGPRLRGSLSRRKRLQTVECSGQQLPRECRPSSDQLAAPADPWLAPRFTSTTRVKT